MEPTRNNGLVENTAPDEKHIMQWIAAKPLSDQEQATREHIQRLLEAASQPQHASGNACLKLCYFLEQCRKSTSAVQREVAFSQKTCLDLYNFYVEWNDKYLTRSMRQVQELLASLVTLNPEKSVSSVVKMEILERVLSVITHQSAQLFVKPSFKVLECFLSKDTISVMELINVYGSSAFIKNRANFQHSLKTLDDTNLWHSFVYAVFEWMSLPETSPTAGRLLVTIFQKLRVISTENDSPAGETYTVLWQLGIRHGLKQHPDCLENIKNYLFSPLFKLDRTGYLIFLQDLTRELHVKDIGSQESDVQAFLLLSAMEVGKKSGLVDEDNVLLNRGAAKLHNSIILPEYSVGGFLSHRASIVRSAAFSVLVSSICSTRPFTSDTFDLLRQNLGLLYSDTDAKVRNEVLSNTKHMVERLRGAVSFLIREVASLNVKDDHTPQKKSKSLDFSATGLQETNVLQEHRDFIQWYQNFLVNELIPTASYQRHITALRAIKIVVDSSLLTAHTKSASDYSTDIQLQGALEENIFTEKTMRILLDLLMNPFEDVRAAATQLLKLMPERCFVEQRGVGSSDQPNFQFFSSLSERIFDRSKSRSSGKLPTEASREQSQQAKVPEILASLIQKAETASRRTGRADLADGVARTSELIYGLQVTDETRLDVLENLLFDLESKVAVAENNLAEAVHLAPVHAQFAALRLVWDLFDQSRDGIRQSTHTTSDANEIFLNKLKGNFAWVNLQYRMIGCCTRIWTAVKNILCNDSPEGHLPQDVDDIDLLDTKDILSYSFRAIHESSNLMRTMVNKLKLKFSDGSPILPFEVFHAAGSLSFEQISNLRHRGAFSTVSLTFARCCQLTQENSIVGQQGAALLTTWYQGALTCIYEQSSTTRRSAGIPALMTGILAANSKSPALEDVMAELKLLARQPPAFTAKDETNLAQVHAMNCIKEIFKSSSLGKRCEDHIVDCLEIAAESLKSKVWAIRNCGLILLRSLIDCLFGTSESKSITESGWDGKSIRLAYERYPALPEILLHLMTTEPNQNAAHAPPQIGAVESVFPALDIIRRAGPPKKLRVEIHSCMKTHLGSSIWHVRDIAARTICTLLLDDEWLAGLLDLLETCSDSANHIHGVLLATKYLLERRLKLNPLTASGGLTILGPKIEQFWAVKPRGILNPMVEAAYEEVAVVMLRIAHLAFSRPMATQSPEEIFGRASMLLQAEHVSSEERILARLIKPTFPNNGSVLLVRAVATRALYTAATTDQMDRLQELIISAIHYDVDIACDLLVHMPLVWNFKGSQAEELSELVDIYVSAYSATSSNNIRTIALQNLADILEHFHRSGSLKQTVISPNKFRGFSLSSLMGGSPIFSNAEIRITGSLLALDFLHHTQQGRLKDITGQIQEWGYMLSDNGKSEKDFDTRYAAIAALGAFYYACSTKIVASSQTSFLVPSLLSLYDTLNDDDDEIRAAGANVVSQILGVYQAPLAASAKLLQWLHQKFGRTEAFCTALMHRIANSNNQANEKLEPGEQQLAAAMLNDDSLFVEEEQNLYVDEVREANAWTALLVTAERPLYAKETDQLLSWALEALVALTRLVETEDGPFGWSSKPRVFAICMKIVLTAKAILARYDKNCANDAYMVPQTEWEGNESVQDRRIKGKPLRDVLHRLFETGRRNNLHPVLLDELAI